MVDPGQLKPIQSHVNQSKIDGMIEADKAGTLDVAEKNVMVSSDDYLIDYHHRAVAADQFGKPMTATVIGLPAKELIEKRPESS